MAKRNPHQLALEFRKRLVALDDKAARAILAEYKPIEEHLKTRLVEIRAAMDAIGATIQGNPTEKQKKAMANQLAQKVRTAKLLEQVAAEVQIVAEKMTPALAAQQREALNMGNAHAHKLLLATGQEAGLSVEWNHVPVPAIEVMVGYMGDGTPIADFLTSKLSKDVFQRMRSTILAGLATGAGIDKTARELAGALEGNRTRAQTIARTETLRAYREAAREEYQANDDIVEGWVWTAARDGRTCAVCWAMDGRKFANEVPFASHVNCRCVARPYTKTFKELGISGVEETRPEVELGEKAFAKLPDKQQRATLGKRAFEAYKAGQLPLKNLVGYKLDDTWGPSRVRRRLADALEGPDQRAFVSTRLRDKPKRGQPEIKPAPPVLEEPVEAPKPDTPPVFQFPQDPDKLKVVKKLGGTTGAELVEDAAGNRFVRKRGANAEHLREEALTDALYRAAGVNVPDFRLYETAGGPVKLARFIDGTELSKLPPLEAAAIRKELGKHFAVDAFLANQDVAGTGDDNILIDREGKPWRIDNGSGLRFRAQGAQKAGAAAFDEFPLHFFSMRDSQFLAGKTFGDLTFYQAGRQVTRLLDQQDAIMRAAKLAGASPEMLKTLAARFRQFEDLEEIAFQFENDSYTHEYANDFARHVFEMRQAGLFNQLAPALGQSSGVGDVMLEDHTGRQWNHIRSKETTSAYHAYLDKAGGSSAHLNVWAGEQAGSSWRNTPAAWKEIIMNQRATVSRSAWVGNVGNMTTKRGLEWVKKQGWKEDVVQKTVLIQHAYTYNLLSHVALPNGNQETRTMRLARTDPSDEARDIHGKLLSSYPSYRSAASPPVEVEPVRGAAESFSVYGWVHVRGDVHTLQEVPHHRIYGTYLQSRQPELSSGMFAGDYENEFIVDSQGLKAQLVHSRKSVEEIQKPYTPGDTAARLAVQKENWQAENRGGQAIKRTAEELPPVVKVAAPAPKPPAPPPVIPTGNQLPTPGFFVDFYYKAQYQALSPELKVKLNEVATKAGKAAVKLGEDAGVTIKPYGMTFKKAYTEAAIKFAEEAAATAQAVPPVASSGSTAAANAAFEAAKQKAAADLLNKPATPAPTGGAFMAGANEAMEAGKQKAAAAPPVVKLKKAVILEAKAAGHAAQQAKMAELQKSVSGYFDPWAAKEKAKEAYQKAYDEHIAKATAAASVKLPKVVLTKKQKITQAKFANEMAEAAAKLETEKILEAGGNPATLGYQQIAAAKQAAYDKALAGFFQATKALTHVKLEVAAMYPVTAWNETAYQDGVDAMKKALENLLKAGVTDLKILKAQATAAYWKAYEEAINK